MDKQGWLSLMQQLRAIGVVRCAHLQTGQQMARAIAAGGMRLIEITWNSDRPAELVNKLRADLPDCWIGAGTLLNQRQMQEAIAAGAQYLFTPHVATDLIQLANAQNLPIVVGALSPTEIVTAWQAGASSVKVFPVQALGGVGYIRSLQGPLGAIPLVPTGGVTLANTVDFLQAGAIAVGLSSDLFPPAAMQAGNWPQITAQAAKLIQQIATIDPLCQA